MPRMPWIWLATCVGLVTMPAMAGEHLTPAMLAREADAVARVSVRFRPQRVVVEEWLKPADAVADVSWLGLCLPGRKLLGDWRTRYRGFRQSQPVWRAALARGGYEAVVVLRRRDGVLRPYCEAESLLAEHWLGHPGHVAWRAALEAGLASPAED